jgi:hypothetical protein
MLVLGIRSRKFCLRSSNVTTKGIEEVHFEGLSQRNFKLMENPVDIYVFEYNKGCIAFQEEPFWPSNGVSRRSKGYLIFPTITHDFHHLEMIGGTRHEDHIIGEGIQFLSWPVHSYDR